MRTPFLLESSSQQNAAGNAQQPGPQCREPADRQHLRPARDNPPPSACGSLADLGPAEANQKLSTSATTGNDVITGTNAANNLVGFAGNDYLKGLGGRTCSMAATAAMCSMVAPATTC